MTNTEKRTRIKDLTSIRTYWTAKDKRKRNFIIIRDKGRLPLVIDSTRYSHRISAADLFKFDSCRWHETIIPITREQATKLVGTRITFVV